MTLVNSTATRDCLLGTNEILVSDAVVTAEEQSTLLAWAEAQYRSGKLFNAPSDPGLYSTPFQSASGGLTSLTNIAAQRKSSTEQHVIWVPDADDQRMDRLPEEFWRIRARVIDRLGLSGLEEDHYKGSFLSYIAPGTGVHTHRDGRLTIQHEEQLILRCNVLFKRPQEGGLPVVESMEIDVPDRGMWVFFPTELMHSATPVGGEQFRGLLSFGFLVRFADLWQRRFRMTQSFVLDYGLAAGDAPRRALVEQLRRAPAAQGVGKDRIDLLEFILTSPGDFSVVEAARSLQQQPSDTLNVLHDLQRSQLVESHSSMRSERGRVWVV